MKENNDKTKILTLILRLLCRNTIRFDYTTKSE